MKHPVTLYSPPAPDFGGLQGRFADIRNRRETSLFWEHFATAAQITLGAVAGLAVAWVLV